MTIRNITDELAKMGLGGTDVLTGETIISGAILEESINGDGGLSLSWRSARGGFIRGGTKFLGYVMRENYVPTLGTDGLYSWSPKFSEPAVLLEKNNYGKRLTFRSDSKIYNVPDGNYPVVEVVVNTDSELIDSSDYSDGQFAIVTAPDVEQGYASGATLRVFIDDDDNYGWYDSGPIMREMDVCQLSTDGTYLRYIGGKWLNVGKGDGTETSIVYTSVFYGEVRTIVEDLNAFFAQNETGFSIELRADTNAQLSALREKVVMVTFDGSSYKQLIDDIATEADAHSFYVGNKIVIGKTKAYADTDFFNRFIVLGGTKNMAKRTVKGEGYAPLTQRLHLDEKAYPGSVIDLREDKEKEAPFETFLVFDDVYPKLNLTIRSAVCRQCYMLDDNGKKIVDHWTKNGQIVAEGTEGAVAVYKLYARWYVTFALNGQPYQIDKSYIIQDKPLSLLFQSGPLTGRQFELTMLTEGKREKDADDVADGHTAAAGECYIIFEADGELLLPSLPADGLVPQVGNWVTLVNVAIEDRLRVAAQEELLAKGMERAQLIYKSGAQKIDEERTFTDALTGESSGDIPGLGEAYKGYVVTGISTNLFTGSKTVTYGTFKPKGLVRSAIDKIESFSLSGGVSTTGKEVSTKSDGTSTIIYIHDGNEDGDGSTTGGSNNQSTSQTIRQAGGNTNIKTVYEKVGGVEKSVKESEAFAELARQIWEHRKSTEATWTTVNVTLATESSANGYWSNGTTAKYNGGDAPAALVSAFVTVYAHVGAAAFTYNIGSKPGTPNKYDIYVEKITFKDGVTDTAIEGGIQAWLCIEQTDEEGATPKEWIPILDSTTAAVENFGNALRLVVFGSQNGTIESAGMLTTQNCVSLFAQAVSLKDGNTLAEAALGLGIRYRLTKSGTTRPVRYDTENGKWIYTDTAGGDVATDDVQHIEAYGFSYLSADTIDFTAGEFTIGASHILISGSERLDAFVSGEEQRIDNRITRATSGMMTESNFVTIFSRITSVDSGDNGSTIAEAMFGLGVKYRYVDGQGAHDVQWDGQSWWYDDDGSTSYVDAQDVEPYSIAGLTADMIDFKGKTIALTAQSGLTISGGTINMSASEVKVRANRFTVYKSDSDTAIALFSNDKLNLTTANASIDAESINFNAKQITINAGETLTITGNNAQGQNQGTIDFTGARILMNASQIGLDADGIISILAGGDLGVVFKKESGSVIQMGKFDNSNSLVAGLEFTVSGTAPNQTYTLNLNASAINLNAERITWKGENGSVRDIITNTETVDGQQVVVKKFSVDENGNVTMNNLTANNGTFTGVVNAQSGTIAGDMVIGNATDRIVLTPTSRSYCAIVGMHNNSEVFRLGPDTNANPYYLTDHVSLQMGNTYLSASNLTVAESSSTHNYASLSPGILQLSYGNGTYFKIQMDSNGLHIYSTHWVSNKGAGNIVIDSNGFLKWESSQ